MQIMSQSYPERVRRPPLAPRPPRPPEIKTEEKAKEPVSYKRSKKEWMDMRPLLEKLYIREQRRLNMVMKYMEEKEGFYATKQMYKKRFSKWGLQKNTPRTPPGAGPVIKSEPAEDDESRRGSSDVALVAAFRAETDRAVVPVVLTVAPTPTRFDTLSGIFVTKIKDFGNSHYDRHALAAAVLPLTGSGPSGSTTANTFLPFIPYIQPFDSEPINRSIKLTADLLGLSQGNLAGRLARKLCLHLDEMLSLESPILLWNLTEMMYNMAARKQIHLLRAFSGHVADLGQIRFGPFHPLPQIMKALRRILDLPDPALEMESLLQQATEFSMAVVVDNFSPERVDLLQGVLWDSASIRVPATHVEAMKSSFLYIENAVNMAPGYFDPVEGTACGVFACAVLNKGFNVAAEELSERGSGRHMPSLPALLESLQSMDGLKGRVPRPHAQLGAVVLKAMAENNREVGLMDEAAMGMMHVIALREYAHGETDPAVVNELFVLEDIRRRSGKTAEADAIHASAIRRIEAYLVDIPPDSV